MSKPSWTLVALTSLGGTALADTTQPIAADDMASETVTVTGSHRGVAHDYLVAPDGGELTGEIKFVMADAMPNGSALKFTDLALFDLVGRWSLFGKLELSGSVDFLPKQPSTTAERAWQSAGGAVRAPLGPRAAITLSGGGGHLLDHTGMWSREALALEWKKPIDPEFLAFDIQGGVDGITLSAPRSRGAEITELSVQTSALFHTPHGECGAWVGIGYAIPVQSSGLDPTTGMALDPQPRLDFHAGAVLAIEKTWDLFADFAVIDRGDLANAATRLPILDGGFDQKQIIFGVTRHIDPPHHRNPDVDPQNAYQLE
ncbi:MAG: hypothetical protein ABJE66_09220 [Deltaproteobacteria bacterium]